MRLLKVLTLLCALSSQASAAKPNIILVYADDISARELPIYGSSVWTKEKGVNSSDAAFRARTPVLDQMADEGCWVKTAWASVVCSPSRAMMMTGRYAHLHKWWNNKAKGRYLDENGKAVTWPLYMSSPTLIGHVAQKGGYGTYWGGKTQMAGDLREFGFDQGCFTPGNLSDRDNPYTDFKLIEKKVGEEKKLYNADTNEVADTYLQHGWYFYPHVRLMNHDGKDFQWWPNTPESQAAFGKGTYGPDVELQFIFDFMDRQHKKDEPFFVYHTTHLGHGAFDWLNPENGQCWPGTPVIKWDGQEYSRVEPNITGDEGIYDTHGTVTDDGIQSHINYLDYQMWLYRNKLQEMGIDDNTIIIFCADNGTSGYGKNSHDRQKGVHVPLIVYAPGMTKHGQQDVLVNMSDMLPTIAELAGVEIPDDYEVNGKSLVPFLFTDQAKHRDWIYGYSRERQIIRGDFVMRDGNGKWWDVSNDPADLISFDEITDWDQVSDDHRHERDELNQVLPDFDRFEIEPNAPGVQIPARANAKSQSGKSQSPKQKPPTAAKPAAGWTLAFQDDYESRDSIGQDYATARGMSDAWTVEDGILIGKQTNDDHGAVIRTEIDFDDVDIQFDFRFSGGTSFNFVIDDKDEKSVHAGHICRASLSPKRLSISDDKVGGMNLEVRKQRQSTDLSDEESKALQTLLDDTKSTVAIDVQPGQWHTLRLRIRGDIMKAFLDGEMATSLRSPGFDHPTKTKLGFTVNGSTIDFDNLQIRVPKSNAPAPDLKISFEPVKASSVFSSDTWSHWGGSVVKGDDGLYHMLYSRWPKKLGWAWVTDSEIAHAQAASPLGPFTYNVTALPRRGKEKWDGWCTHNPTVHRFGKKYYLYYMGNTGDGEIVGYPGKHLLNWQHRNNQRIGVAVADHPSGPWTRMDEPVLDVSADDSAWDSLVTSNPSVCQRPDGGFLMVYKAVGKEFPLPNGGPVVHCVATSDSPTGPFVKSPDPVFTFEGERFPAEDPYIWFQEGKYRAIVKRIKHLNKKRVFSLVQYDSVDGVDWKPSKYHEISDRTVTWADGKPEQFDHLERPQVVVEDGVPVALVCAADRIDENRVRQSFNIQIPLKVEVKR